MLPYPPRIIRLEHDSSWPNSTQSKTLFETDPPQDRCNESDLIPLANISSIPKTSGLSRRNGMEWDVGRVRHLRVRVTVSWDVAKRLGCEVRFGKKVMEDRLVVLETGELILALIFLVVLGLRRGSWWEAYPTSPLSSYCGKVSTW
jgi:hypothetical protein